MLRYLCNSRRFHYEAATTKIGRTGAASSWRGGGGGGRPLWGLIVVTACSHIGTATALRKDPQLGGVALAALFLFTEVCPFALALDSGFLRLVDADAVTTAPTHVYGTAPSPMRVESSGQFV